MSDKYKFLFMYNEFGIVMVFDTWEMSGLVYRRLDNDDEVWEIWYWNNKFDLEQKIGFMAGNKLLRSRLVPSVIPRIRMFYSIGQTTLGA
jgi:hypothetical protein